MEEKNKLPQRKGTRLKNFDYSTSCAYFVTICTNNRKRILSKISVGEGSPLPQLTKFGKIADTWINGISQKYPETHVDCYVIMPDHIHILISLFHEYEMKRLENTEESSQSQVEVSGSSPLNDLNFHRKVDSIIGWLKYKITTDINKMNVTPDKKIFQRSFFDHIIRNRDDYYETKKYILENPKKWRENGDL